MKVYKEDKNLIEARKWFVIGAYLSGSPEGKISEDTGFSRAYVTRIVANFKKTGSPSVSQRTRRKERREYDLYDSDDEISDLYKLVPKNMNKKKPAAKDVIAYVLYKAQKNEESIQRPAKWRLPTPPRDPNTLKDSPTHSIALPPSPPLCELAEPSEYSTTKPDYAWTNHEDKILLAHVLTRRSGFRFKEAEDKLGGRHSADDCKKRWEILRDLILRGSQKVDSLF